MAYTAHESPAAVHDRVSQFEDLRVYLPVTLRPDCDGSLSVATKPPLKLSVDAALVLESPLGCVAIDAVEANNLKRWLSASLRGAVPPGRMAARSVTSTRSRLKRSCHCGIRGSRRSGCP